MHCQGRVWFERSGILHMMMIVFIHLYYCLMLLPLIYEWWNGCSNHKENKSKQRSGEKKQKENIDLATTTGCNSRNSFLAWSRPVYMITWFVFFLPFFLFFLLLSAHNSCDRLHHVDQHIPVIFVTFNICFINMDLEQVMYSKK